MIFRPFQSVHISNVPVHGGLLSECFVTILALVELDPHMNGHVFSQAVFSVEVLATFGAVVSLDQSS